MRRLRAHLPAVLVALGLVLGGGVAVALLIGRHEGGRPASSAQPTSTTSTATKPTAPPSTTTPPPSPPPSPATPTDVHVDAVSPFSASLSWHTAVPTSGEVALGSPTLGPARWLPVSAARDHRIALTTLGFPVSYRVWISSRAASGEQADAVADFATSAPAGAVSAGTRGGAVTLDGSAWFPMMVYGACSTYYPSLLADGITLFAQNPCGGLDTQLSALAGRGLSAALAGTDDGAGAPGVVGAFYPDEADARGVRGESLPAAPPGLRFLTLSNHVFSGAAPPPTGRGVYVGLIARADVVGFDLYPLQGWCARDRLVDVYAAQREVAALAGDRPTFQWIEAAGMNCPTDPAVAVTPDTVRAEAWLAIAGGAHGLGFFPAAWTGDVGGAIRQVAEEVALLLPALEGGQLALRVEPADPNVRAAAWASSAGECVVVVNAGTSAARVTLETPSLGERSMAVLGEDRSVQAHAGAIADVLAPLQVHVYVAAP